VNRSSRARTIFSRIRSGLLNLIGAYALGTLIFLLLRTLIPEQSWGLIGFMNSFAQIIWLLAVIFFLPVLLARRWNIAVLLLPAVVLFLFFYGVRFVPRTIPVPAESQPITLLTYNIQATNLRYSRVIDTIRAADADIVAIQEVNAEIGPLLEEAFADSYQYIALHPNSYGYAGQGVLSRFPIVEDRYWRTDPVWGLGHQRVEIQLPDDQIFTLYNAHPVPPRFGGLSFSGAFRDYEITQVLEMVAAETDPLLLVGDFNLTDQNAAYPQLIANLHDAYREVGYGLGWTFTHMFPIPILRLDYVFHTDHWTAHEIHVQANSGGSDHYPVKVTLTLTDSRR
jgi:vancomycin resistance protein VanJ